MPLLSPASRERLYPPYPNPTLVASAVPESRSSVVLSKTADPEIHVGDTVRFSIEGKVTRIKDDIFEGASVVLDNIFDKAASIRQVRKGDVKFELLKRARPLVGEVVDGKNVKDTQWKRGTVIRGEISGHVLVLNGDGVWINSYLEPSHGYDDEWPFSDLTGPYKLIFEPSAK